MCGDFILGGVTLVFDSLAPYKGMKATLRGPGTELETADLGIIAHFSEVLHMKCQSF